MMSRRDYNAIASAIAEYRRNFILGDKNWEDCLMDILAEQVADALKTTNPRFNRDRFISACQVSEKP